MQEIEPRLDEAVQAVLSIDHCVAARNSFGGTAPNEVRARISAARQAFLEG
jgi:argininosuccinate lyase